MKVRRSKTHQAVLAACLCVASPFALAHGGVKHEPAKAATVEKIQQPWGMAGDAKTVTRDIAIRMTDQMRFEPDRITVRQGDTIRFVNHNAGQVMHEMVIGTREILDEHAEMMAKFPDMEHDEPWMTHVAPGEKGEILWTFNRPGTFEFACLLPGHYEAGMTGTVVVERR